AAHHSQPLSGPEPDSAGPCRGQELAGCPAAGAGYRAARRPVADGGGGTIKRTEAAENGCGCSAASGRGGRQESPQAGRVRLPAGRNMDCRATGAAGGLVLRLDAGSAASQDRRCRAAPERRHGQGATLYGAACNDAGSDGVAGLVAAAPWDDSRQGQSEPRDAYRNPADPVETADGKALIWPGHRDNRLAFKQG